MLIPPPLPDSLTWYLLFLGVVFSLKVRIIANRTISSPCFWKTNHTKRAIKCRIKKYKCLNIFIYTPNIYVQDREIVFTNTFKNFINLFRLQYLPSRRETSSLKFNIWIAFRTKKIIVHCKRIIWNRFESCVRRYLSWN